MSHRQLVYHFKLTDIIINKNIDLWLEQTIFSPFAKTQRKWRLIRHCIWIWASIGKSSKWFSSTYNDYFTNSRIGSAYQTLADYIYKFYLTSKFPPIHTGCFTLCTKIYGSVLSFINEILINYFPTLERSMPEWIIINCVVV